MPLILVIRHARSTANEANVPESSVADLAFANKTAEVCDRGKEQCVKLVPVLSDRYGVDIANARVAVSEYVRTQQTACLLGFSQGLTTVRSELNEVDYGMDLAALRKSLRNNEIPPVALKAARRAALRILENPPPERIWITHGLLIAGLTTLVGDDDYERLVPRQCEVRLLPV